MTGNSQGAAEAAPEFVITRTLDAPRDPVWKAWTDPAHLARWWGPHGFTCPVCEVDLRVGGAYRLVMRGTDEMPEPYRGDYPMSGVYREVAPPERLVFTARTDGHPDWWNEMLNGLRGTPGAPAPEVLFTVTFAEAPGGTLVTIHARFPSDVDRDAFVEMGMNEGWRQSLEKLEALVAEG